MNIPARGLAALTTMLLAPIATAAFTGVEIVEVTDFTGLPNGAGVQAAYDASNLAVCRVYLLFDDLEDDLVTLGGTNSAKGPEFGPFHVVSSDGAIFNNEIDPPTQVGFFAPSELANFQDPTAAFDSYIALGTNAAPLRFGEIANGTIPMFEHGLSTVDGGIVTTPNGAGVAGSQPEPGRVFAMQVAFDRNAGVDVDLWFAFLPPTAGVVINHHVSFTCGDPPQPCYGDVNLDETVDLFDLIEVLINQGPCTGCPADIDGSGVVDTVDILLVIIFAGPCPNQIGSCTYPGGTCIETTPGYCKLTSGTYVGGTCP